MRKCRVLCRDINEKRWNYESYKAPDNRYYSSEEAYNKIVEKKNKVNNDRTICISKLMDLMDYSSDIPMPTIAYKRLEELAGYGYDVIYETICKEESSILWALSHKEFKSEVNKIQYIFAIIQNNCKEVLDKVRREEKLKKQDNKSVEIVDDFDTVGTKKRSKNVNDLLGDI